MRGIYLLTTQDDAFAETMTMETEAKKILGVFRQKGLKADDFIHFCDFGEAIVWEAGCVRDEPVRKALETLINAGYVDEMPAGLRLTTKGEKAMSET